MHRDLRRPKTMQPETDDHLQHRHSKSSGRIGVDVDHTSTTKHGADLPSKDKSEPGQQPILKAYLEPIDQDQWNVKPLPVRTQTAKDLEEVHYPQLNSCSRLPEQWPVDNYPDNDPFLPWIHDVFPTHDGKFVQFVAQNKRRCNTGSTDKDTATLKHTQPQLSLFQHVPVKRLEKTADGTRYRLSTHEEADEDGVETRFICRFKPTMEETLSVHNFHYDYVSYRKGHKQTFTSRGKWDIKSLHTTQLIFQCPVPEGLQQRRREGSSVINDYATTFVDLIPIRTPPRYGEPNVFFPPRYDEFMTDNRTSLFRAEDEFGMNHVLPKIEDSGRWENIPICKPSLQTYAKSPSLERALTTESGDNAAPLKQNRLIACVWASAGYATRGERFAISDGERRLREWLHYNFLVGFDHIYVYDNSGAQSASASLQSITDEFPDRVTRIVWPSKVCNNNRNFDDSPGERSSQYAAESSCRLRFGPHVDWIGQFDIDEYVVPMGKYDGVKPLLDQLESENKRIVSFGSWRAWPRKKLIE